MDINWIQYIVVLAIVLINHSIRKLNTVIFLSLALGKSIIQIRSLKIIIIQLLSFPGWQSVFVYSALTAVIKLVRVYDCVCVR